MSTAARLRLARISQIPVVAREAVLAAVLCLAGAVLLKVLTPLPDDASAHLYRALLVQREAVLWDNFWYGGDYPLLSYSLLAYLPQQVVGPVTLGLLAVVGSAATFAVLVVQRWGAGGAWGSRAFALLALGPLFTGGYAYAVGAAALLACLLALQNHRVVIGAVLGAVTLGLSPLAFLFLGLILVAVWLEHRRLDPRTLVVAVWLGALVAVQLVIGWLFPSDGIYPFLVGHLIAILVVSVLGVAVARRHPEAHLIMWLMIAWAAGSLLLFAIPTPIGDNLARLRYFGFPIMLVAAGLVGWRPKALIVVALAASFGYGAIPDLVDAVTRTDSRPTQPTFWAPAVRFLRQHQTPDYRVEVVQTAGRWEAYWIPEAGFPLVRGWYRQMDLVENPLLYEKVITAQEYEAWLRSRAVRYVLLPSTALDSEGATAEADLLRSGRSGLRLVERSGAWTFYELPDPSPLMTGPGTARITAQGHDALSGTVSAAGLYQLRVRWMPYWTLQGAVDCVAPDAGGQTVVRASGPGAFTLAAGQRADLFVERIFAPPTGGSC